MLCSVYNTVHYGLNLHYDETNSYFVFRIAYCKLRPKNYIDHKQVLPAPLSSLTSRDRTDG